MGAIIKIADVTIQQDQQGRYRLNDLHKAAGSEAKHKPANWLRLDATIGLCAEIDQFSDMSSAQVVNGGMTSGTYVCKELVYAYAMWISPSFHLKVIRTFDTATTADPLAHIPPEHRALVALLCENVEIKATQAVQAESIKRIEAKQSAFENGACYFAVLAFAVMREVVVNNSTAARIGKLATALSKARDILIGKVRDERYGKVNTYHESVLDTAFAEVMGGSQ